MLVKEFFTAGKAKFTVSNDVSGERFTYEIIHKKAKGQWPENWFVSYLTGPDNDSDFTYLGKLIKSDLTVIPTVKSKLTPDSKPFKVLNWALKQIVEKKELPEGYAIRHSGVCARCGRTLTVPASITTGLGPECSAKMGIFYGIKDLDDGVELDVSEESLLVEKE